MKRKELIEAARICATGRCTEDCIFFNEDADECWNMMMSHLVEELDKATLKIIPVGNGQDYEVRVNEKR